VDSPDREPVERAAEGVHSLRQTFLVFMPNPILRAQNWAATTKPSESRVEGDKYRETCAGHGGYVRSPNPPTGAPGLAPHLARPPPRKGYPAKSVAIAGVAAAVVVAGVLVAAYAGYRVLHPPELTFNNIHVIQVDVTNDSLYTIITLLSVPPSLSPATTYFAIQHDSTTILPRTPVSSLTETNWSENFALYDDRNPTSPEIQAGDAFLVSRAYYRGYWAEISTDDAILLQQTLR